MGHNNVFCYKKIKSERQQLYMYNRSRYTPVQEASSVWIKLQLPFLRQYSWENRGMHPKTEPHMDHFASQLCMGILVLSQPWHQETEKFKVQLLSFIIFIEKKCYIFICLLLSEWQDKHKIDQNPTLLVYTHKKKKKCSSL